MKYLINNLFIYLLLIKEHKIKLKEYEYEIN